MPAPAPVAVHLRAPEVRCSEDLSHTHGPELTATTAYAPLPHSTAATAGVLLRSASVPSDPVAPQIRRRRYNRVLIVADFTDTADVFHHRLIRVAQRLAPCVDLLQFATDCDNTQADSSTEILLEGLLHRLGLGAKTCAIVPPCPLSLALCSNDDDRKHQLLLFGRSTRQRLHRECMKMLVDHAKTFGCDLITIDDASDAD